LTQYILAAATLPSYGLKSVDALVKRSFPTAVRATAEHMHRQHPAIAQRWVRVGDAPEDREQALIQVTVTVAFVTAVVISLEC
jgi:superfamily II DNA/RNA helicase